MADGSASVGALRLHRSASADCVPTGRPHVRRGSAAAGGAARLQASVSLESGNSGITRGRRSSAVGVTRGRRGSAIAVAATGPSQVQPRTSSG
jgi:hypothetical protein